MAPRSIFDLLDSEDSDAFFTEGSKLAREALKDIERSLNTFPMDLSSNFPPHNLSIATDGSLVLDLAIAGYDENTVTLKAEDERIIVSAPKQKEDETKKYLPGQHGIRGSEFRVIYPVSDKYDIGKTSAKMKGGILTISVPLKEEKKPQEHVINIEK